MKVSELIESLSRYDRDDDVTFYYLKNNVLTNCQFEDLGFYGDMGVEFTIQEELFDQIEELNTSLRELTDFELVDCRQALINRTNILMGLLEELEDS